MRITNGMMANTFLTSSNSGLNKVSKTYTQVTTGKRNASLADDPVSTVAGLRARSAKTTTEMYQDNITTATDSLNEISDTADAVNTLVQSAYESMVKANTGSKTQSDLNTIAEAMKNMRDSVLNDGNTTLGSIYLFGGYSTESQPFTTNASGELLYNGINVSDQGAYEDYTENLSKINGSDGLLTKINTLYTQLTSSSTSDYQAKNSVSSDLYTALKDFVSTGTSMISEAKSFISGFDTSTQCTNLTDLVKVASNMMSTISSENSQNLQPDKCCVISDVSKCKLDGSGAVDTAYYAAKGVTLISSSDSSTYENQGYTVVTGDTYDNYFSKDKVVASLQSTASSGTVSLTNFATDLGTEFNALTTGTTGISTTYATAFSSMASAKAALADEQNDQVQLQVGATHSVATTYSGTSLMGSGNDNLYYVMNQCVDALTSGDTAKFGTLVTKLQNCQSNVLNFETDVGATINRLTTLSSRYDSSITNYETMRSDAEDIDEAEAITNWKTAQTVYNAALSAGSQLLQTSLIDFLK